MSLLELMPDETAGASAKPAGKDDKAEKSADKGASAKAEKGAKAEAKGGEKAAKTAGAKKPAPAKK